MFCLFLTFSTGFLFTQRAYHGLNFPKWLCSLFSLYNYFLLLYLLLTLLATLAFLIFLFLFKISHFSFLHFEFLLPGTFHSDFCLLPSNFFQISAQMSPYLRSPLSILYTALFLSLWSSLPCFIFFSISLTIILHIMCLFTYLLLVSPHT